MAAHTERADAGRGATPRRPEGLTLRISLVLGLGYVVLLAIVAMGVPLALNLEGRVSSEVRSQARSQADLLAATAADLLDRSRRGELAGLVARAGDAVRGRVIVVDGTGVVLADSAGPGRLGANYSSRPEVAAALKGTPVQAQRYSRTLGQEILFTAVPIFHEGGPVGAVRVTQSVSAVNTAVRRVELGLGLVALLVLAIGLTVGWLIAREISRPLLRLEQVTGRVAAGDLDARAQLEGSREQRSLSASFNEMAARISRLLSSQKAFVADASHQLRTPLTGLRLRLEEAREAGSIAAAREEIDAGLAEVDRLAEIIEELLLLSRAGERELPGEAVSLTDVTRDALERFKGAAEGRPLLRGPLVGGDCTVWSARSDVERALDVLIENAIHYSPESSPVTVTCRPGAIEVADRGPGLATGEAEAVFERFHRGSAGAGIPGTGLGLAIARELARSWGGDVTLTNRDGGGALATLSLPQAP